VEPCPIIRWPSTALPYSTTWGRAAALRDRMLEILQNGNEGPDGFRVTSRYIVATTRRS